MTVRYCFFTALFYKVTMRYASSSLHRGQQFPLVPVFADTESYGHEGAGAHLLISVFDSRWRSLSAAFVMS